MNYQIYFSPILSFALTLVMIPALRSIAIRVGLIDKPNQRKVHTNPVPLVGGIGIFASISLTLGLVFPSSQDLLFFKNIFVASLILLIMGVIDDRYNLKASLKLVIQLLLAHFIFMQGIKIESLNGLFGIYHLADWAQYLLTVVTIAGVVNAFNLMDGIDGLAAGLSIVGFGIFATISLVTLQPTLALFFMTFIGALLAFLYFNLSKRKKVFMGDAGSLMIGFILVISGIKLIQDAQGTVHISAVILAVISFMIIPVFDALRVFRKRIKAGKSPFSADKSHLHHLLLSIGLKHKFAALAIVLITILTLVIGFVSFNIIGLTVSIALVVFLYIVISSLLQFNDKILAWKRRIKTMERMRNF